jgi:hypothetical protein
VSAAIAGVAGALLSVHLGSAGVQDFELLSPNGLPWLLLLVLGGVGVVSGAVMGGFTYQFIFFLSDKLSWTIPLIKKDIFTVQERVGPGLLGIGIGRQPEGVIPNVGHDVREKRAKKAAASQRAQQAGNGQAPPPDAPPPPDSETDAASAPAPTPGA